MHQESKKAVFAALLANLGIAIFKITAALISNSSSMLAEGYHSISDTFNQVLLLIGLKRSRKAPNRIHPFGHGKEQFFWSFLVAIILFGIAGTLSVREGLQKFRHPHEISHLWLTYLALGVAMVAETVAFRMALKNIKASMQEDGIKKIIEGVISCKDTATLTVLIEDLLAMTGLVIAAAAITLAHITGNFMIDAVASVIIGALLMGFALFLAFETQKLLVGESVTPNKRKRIIEAVQSFEDVNKIISLKTMHLSSEEVLVTLEINYRDGLVVDEVEALNDRIEAKIKEILPSAKVYLEAENW
jgi:cation diffusion facilitator family transporter